MEYYPALKINKLMYFKIREKRKVAYNTSYLKFKNKNQYYKFPAEIYMCSKSLQTN